MHTDLNKHHEVSIGSLSAYVFGQIRFQVVSVFT